MIKLKEFELINWISRQYSKSQSVKKGIGDDTAVLAFNKRYDLLVTTDMLVEGVHFTSQTKGWDIGHKAIACNISDIAAMGGLPAYALIALGVPRSYSTKKIQQVYQGLNALAKKFGIKIIGGDTVKSECCVIDITLMGKVERNKAILRKGAKPGDQIFVTGPLGGSLLSGRHLTFLPRVDQARYLARKFPPTSMIDISDGLAQDLGHVLRQSRVGARLWAWKIPLHEGVSLSSGLSDGEDFELLFTLKRPDAKKLLALKNSRFYFYHIGEIVASPSQIHLLDEQGNDRICAMEGYSHF